MPRLSRDDLFQGAGLVVHGDRFSPWAVFLPLYAMLSKSLEDADGNFIGFANYLEYFGTPDTGDFGAAHHSRSAW